ncbi:hypothetical protein VTJ04DRAFT_1776 [Mycothermus thermophilus]|uniref:uncharacterized protein n=1 Tax=Humicola insolens TaxID=85995 RepID=UPI0037427EC7
MGRRGADLEDEGFQHTYTSGRRIWAFCIISTFGRFFVMDWLQGGGGGAALVEDMAGLRLLRWLCRWGVDGILERAVDAI